MKKGQTPTNNDDIIALGERKKTNNRRTTELDSISVFFFIFFKF
jgi:hypothetical protein